MIIDFVLATRRQVVKLLVLLRWSRDNTRVVQRCMNLIAFLQRQNFQLERAVDSLKSVQDALLSARIRNYDLLTAVDVLSAGQYVRLPRNFNVIVPLNQQAEAWLTIYAVLQDVFLPPPKLKVAEVLNLLVELESVMRYRLQLHEHLPSQLLTRPYQIRRLNTVRPANHLIVGAGR